jgi:hypothetical protein
VRMRMRGAAAYAYAWGAWRDLCAARMRGVVARGAAQDRMAYAYVTRGAARGVMANRRVYEVRHWCFMIRQTDGPPRPAHPTVCVCTRPKSVRLCPVQSVRSCLCLSVRVQSVRTRSLCCLRLFPRGALISLLASFFLVFSGAYEFLSPPLRVEGDRCRQGVQR